MRPEKPGDPSALGVDPDAFEAFYRAHVREIERFIARRVGDPHEAADLTADVFLAVLARAGSYRPDRGSVLAWTYGIARHTVIDHQRRASRDQRLVGRVSGRALLDADSLARVEERLDAGRAARELYAAICRLPDAERAVLELIALDGLTLADVAAVLDIKPVTARVRLHRARRRLTPATAPTPAVLLEVIS